MTLINKLRHIGYALSVGTLSVLAVNVEPAKADYHELSRGYTIPTEVTPVRWTTQQHDHSNKHTGPGVLECNTQTVGWSTYPVRVCRIGDNENGGYFHFATSMKPVVVKGQTAYMNVNEWSDTPNFIDANRLNPSLFQTGSAKEVSMNTQLGEMVSTEGGFYYHIFTPIR